MTPYELVKQRYALPFELYGFQADAVNKLAPLEKASYWLDTGTGKTLVSIVATLYKLIKRDIRQCVVLMPPILLDNWGRNLASIPGVTHCIYRGTPTQRRGMDLDVQFLLMSYSIFAIDSAHLREAIDASATNLLCDESSKAKNIKTVTYKKVREWSATSHLMLLSGTPLSNPGDAYAPIKLISPKVYPSRGQFDHIHGAAIDFYGNITTWRNLELLNESLMLRAVRVLKTDVLKDLPPVTHTPVYYAMDAAHMKAYRTLCAEQLLAFSDGRKIDATSASSLFNALQQVPGNREHFTRQEGVDGALLELVHETMEELGERGKLVIFTSYKMTNRLLSDRLKKYGVVAIYSEIAARQKNDNLERFIADPACRVILLQIQSAAFGIDRLQSACSNILFGEMPMVPAWYWQGVARLWRAGQKEPVSVRVAVAEGTIQVRLWEVLQEKDSLVNTCLRGLPDLKNALFGETAHREARKKAA